MNRPVYRDQFEAVRKQIGSRVYDAFERLAVKPVKYNSFGSAGNQLVGRLDVLFQTIPRILYHRQEWMV